MIVAFCVLIAVIVFIAVVLLYSNKAYPEAQEIAGEMEHVDKDYYFYGDSGVGFIIFAGAKADEKAYAYLAELLNRSGHTVVIPKQLFHMSAFGTKHGIEIMDENQDIDKWILIGHSLGGLPVSRIAASSPDRLTGIVFLATYASADLTDLTFPALRITADHDGVMNNDRMDTFEKNLPPGSESIMLEGANHGGFSAYISRSHRDGKASMTWKEQNEQTVELILDFYDDRIEEVENR